MPFPLNLFSGLNFAFPDVLSIFALFTLIMVKVFLSEEYTNKIFPKISLIFSIILFMTTFMYSAYGKKVSSELFIYTSSIGQAKILLFFCLCVLFWYLNYTGLRKTLGANFFILIYGIANAITLSVSANSLITLMLVLELYTFSLSFLLLNDKNDKQHRRCAVQFLLISSIMSSIFVFGCSLIHSQSGSLSFSDVKLTKDFVSNTGKVFIICALLFKLGCAPFHNWMLDVYEKASSIVILFLETIWKLFMIFIFIRVIFVIGNLNCLKIVLATSAVMAMGVGAIMPIFQNNIHKFVASISIGHIGFALSALHIATSYPVVMSYMSYNALAILCFLSGILFIESSHPARDFTDLSGLIKTASIPGLTVLASMFAMCGIPPFGNFMAKINIFKLLLESKENLLLIITVLYSFLSLVYLIKWLRLFFHSTKWESTNPTRHKTILVFLLLTLTISVIFYEQVFIYCRSVFNPA